jgi:hypothetical protein
MKTLFVRVAIDCQSKETCMYKRLSRLILILVLAQSLCLTDIALTQENLSISYISDEGVDNDEDGLYDYIQINLEVKVPQDGLYIVETSDMQDSEGQIIPVKAYRVLTLEQGEHLITITFDGRRIHKSEKNPSGFSFINLITIDYSDADFLNDVKLLNHYSYLDFEEPPAYEVGVNPGDSSLYNVKEFHTPLKDSDLTQLEAIQWRIEDVQGAVVYLEMELLYSNNSTDKENLDGYLEKESLIFPFLIPANLQLGDSFGGGEIITLNKSRTQNMHGHNQTIYTYNEKKTINQTNIEYIFNQEYHWEKETGILIEAWFNTTTILKPNDDKNTNNVLITLDETSLFKERTELTLKVDYGEYTILTGQLSDSQNNGIPGQEIILTKDSGETDKYNTNSTGHFKVNLEKTYGNFYAEYLGSVRYSPIEADIYVESENNDNSFLIVSIAIIVILAVSVLFILRKFSII